jgi:hypothetical protein
MTKFVPGDIVSLSTPKGEYVGQVRFVDRISVTIVRMDCTVVDVKLSEIEAWTVIG